MLIFINIHSVRIITVKIVTEPFCKPFITKETASDFLGNRLRRSNIGEPLEKFQEENLERECIEETCNWDEAPGLRLK